MIGWLIITVPELAAFSAGVAFLTRHLHREGLSWAGIIAHQRMKRRP